VITFIDTHTHLFSEKFDADQSQTVQRAIDSGVERMLLPNIDETTLDTMFALCDRFPKNCFPMVGLHPCSVGKNIDHQLTIIQDALWREVNRCVAVGEIGMDLYWDTTFVEEQKIAFRQQIEWAKQLNIPIAIHVREAFKEVLDIIDRLNDERLRGVFHCFTGDIHQAQHILAYGGFYLGIGGVVTYKKSIQLQEVLSQISPQYIVLETDSPYLAPVPHRGKRNESSFLIHIAEKLGDIYQISTRELAKITTYNAEKLFFREKRHEIDFI